MSGSPIEVQNLTKRYGRDRKTVVNDVTLKVEAGTVTGLLGPNGSGKTTILKCLLGLVRPSSGLCRVLGSDASDLSPVVGRIGSLLDANDLDGALSSVGNLRLLLAAARRPPADLGEVLRVVGLAEDKWRQPTRFLSTGQRQRVGLASALVKRPEVLVLDEPERGLDPVGVNWLRQWLRDQRAASTILLSSHLASGLESVCDSVVLLNDGEIAEVGTPVELMRRGGGSEVVVRFGDRPNLLAALDCLVAVGLEPQADESELSLVVKGSDVLDEVGTALRTGYCQFKEIFAVSRTFEQVVVESFKSGNK